MDGGMKHAKRCLGTVVFNGLGLEILEDGTLRSRRPETSDWNGLMIDQLELWCEKKDVTYERIVWPPERCNPVGA